MKRRNGGFTLLELMMTIIVVAILASIAAPSYMQHIQSARREAAKKSLLELAQHLEGYYANHMSYSGATVPSKLASELPYYQLQVSGASAGDYTLLAVPLSSGAQASDKCGTLSLSHNGTRSATGTQCW